MKAIILVAIGGAMGSVLRYGVALWMKSIYSSEFPWHTFAVNIVGCFIIGLFFSWSLQHSTFEDIRLFFMIGILGGFTTYSSFALETFELLKQHKMSIASVYILATNLLGLIAVYLGYTLHKLVS